ncbi:putative methyltransferase PMT19 [Drosera capensis]
MQAIIPSKPLVTLLFTTILCSLCYLFGSYNTSITTLKTPTSCINITTIHNPTTYPDAPLDFSAHHFTNLTNPKPQNALKTPITTCPKNYTNYCPCQDPSRERLFTLDRFFHRERHCPVHNERLTCLVPAPKGYRAPFGWPKSKGMAWFSNVPFKRLIDAKKSQNWVRLEGERLVFPGGGTSFVRGVKVYVEDIRRVVPLDSRSVRTVLDIGCGVASFGAGLLDFDIITMSVAPRDIHEAQVQFALERGLPAMLGILSTFRLPYPSRSFDMAHCSRCLVPWTDHDGLYLIEIDRVLRPGGYWVLSGPPINWKGNYKGWQRPAQDLKNEQNMLENIAMRMCWKKVSEIGNVAIWRKPTNHVHCMKKVKAWKSISFCTEDDHDTAWYQKMEPCITPLPMVENIKDTSGGILQKWPKRLNAIPPRMLSAGVKITSRAFEEDNMLWKGRIRHYVRVLESFSKGRHRNIMDMNAFLGGFAAALSSYPVWVMNVVPFDAKNDTLGMIYERGLIGTCMNWCEAFSTYPRTYDLLHADGVFSMYLDKCDIVDILIEMHRILRPHGAVIVRDQVDIIQKVKDIMERMGWTPTLSHSEQGPFHPEKILFVDNSLNLKSQ